ncbi:MAG TPA: 23S rRNA (adenine(2503)-C(2))-methyltransferase RlmN [Terriglobia bacterium]|nr:23S rRNA (adenine(2503)-C(2))-methyltransferase RlmN [Terriglobia bacterium]
MKSIYDCERADLTRLLSPAYRSTQLFKALYQRDKDCFEVITDLPKAARAGLATEWNLRLPEVHRRFDSVDGTRRYLIRLEDGEFAETVFLPEEHRNTICISSQVGCALACTFCLTGQLGLTRNLSAGEIVTQVLLAQRDNLRGEFRDSFNIVLMGMGEPLHNYDNVMKAIRILHDKAGLNMSMSRITLSTAGMLPGIERLATETDIPNLAISLTGATNPKRDELMPINRKYPIQDLIEAVRRFPLRHRQRVTFEYVLLKGITDSKDDARSLVRLLRGMPAKVNLIPFNEAEELPYKRPSNEAIAQFQKILEDAHVDAFVRRNRGNDISAACGQLKKKWADEPSAGVTSRP